MEMSRECWHGLMRSFGFEENDTTFDELKTAYSEPHRHYHTCEHVSAVLKVFDDVKEKTQHPREMELAIWFHDAVYRPRSSTNEHDSAQWASRFLKENGATMSQISCVEELIMATVHNKQPETDDAKLIVDLDLSILGKEPHIYSLFEDNVRREYRWVPYFIYKRKRREVLTAFLERDVIFSLPELNQRFEKQARVNLTWATEQL